MDQHNTRNRLILLATGAVAALVAASTISLSYFRQRLAESQRTTAGGDAAAAMPSAPSGADDEAVWRNDLCRQLQEHPVTPRVEAALLPFLPIKRATGANDMAGHIREIANQSRLLVFNLSIEIAQAVKTARELPGIASGVHAVAEQMAKATDDISRTIEQIQHVPRATERSVEDAVRQGTVGLELASRAGAVLDAIYLRPLAPAIAGEERSGETA